MPKRSPAYPPEIEKELKSLGRALKRIEKKDEEIQRLVDNENERRKGRISELLDEQQSAVCGCCHFIRPFSELMLCTPKPGIRIAGTKIFVYCTRCLTPNTQDLQARDVRRMGLYFLMQRTGERFYSKTTNPYHGVKLTLADVEMVLTDLVVDDELYQGEVGRIRPKEARRIGVEPLLMYCHRPSFDRFPAVLDAQGVKP